MPDKPITLSQQIENVLHKINTGGGNGLNREAAIAELQALLATTIGRDLTNLTEGIHSFKANLGERIDTLNDQMGKTRSELQASSASTTKHSWRIFLVTIASTAVTLAALGLSFYQLQVTKEALQAQIQVASETLQAQVDPELIMEVNSSLEKGTQLVLTNEGTYPVTNVVIDTSDIQFVGAPFYKMLSKIERRKELVGAPWWKIDELKAGETKHKALEEVGQNALAGQRNHRPSIEKGEVPGVPPGSQILSFIRFKVVYHRAVDHKRYEKVEHTVVFEVPKTGKLRFHDPGDLPGLCDALGHLPGACTNKGKGT